MATDALRTLAALQTEPRFGEVDSNLAAIERALDGLQADLVVLPELATTGYAFRDRREARDLAEPWPDGPSLARLRAASAALDLVLVAGFAERDGDRLYNAAAVFASGRALGCYRKVHLFGFEGECFDSGDRGFLVVEHRGMRVGTMVCFDWIFPEACRALALAGAEVVAHPSNLVLPGLCQRAMPVRALENRVFTVTANRVGEERRPPRPALRFTGESLIVGPGGETLARGPSEGPALLQAGADLAEARSKRVASGNDLFAERRPEAYGVGFLPAPDGLPRT